MLSFFLFFFLLLFIRSLQKISMAAELLGGKRKKIFFMFNLYIWKSSTMGAGLVGCHPSSVRFLWPSKINFRFPSVFSIVRPGSSFLTVEFKNGLCETNRRAP